MAWREFVKFGPRTCAIGIITAQFFFDVYVCRRQYRFLSVIRNDDIPPSLYTFERKRVAAILAYNVLHYVQAIVIISFDVLAKLEMLFGSMFGTTKGGPLAALFVLAIEALCCFPVFTYSWYISRNKMRQLFHCGFTGLITLALVAYVPYYLFGAFLLQLRFVPADEDAYVVTGQILPVLTYFWTVGTSLERFPFILPPSCDGGARRDVASMEDGSLRHSIEGLALKAGLKLSDIKIISNNGPAVLRVPAYVTSWFSGAIVLVQSQLLEEFSESEITAVIAQRLVHYRQRNWHWNLLFGLLQVMLYWAILLPLQSVFRVLGINGEPLPSVLQIVAARYMMRSVPTPITMASNAHETKRVYASDAFVAELGYAEALQSALVRMNETMPEIERDWLYGFDNYSSPTLPERIRRLELLMHSSGTPIKHE